MKLPWYSMEGHNFLLVKLTVESHFLTVSADHVNNPILINDH